ncbi:hypothetical protein [Pedobacter sp. MW01-1-1]|uniref:hypothetical protein n=1 Tax=Pedobacter sp. MW01-1-1 TaxID=3383027 RepID=UPI003FEE7F27
MAKETIGIGYFDGGEELGRFFSLDVNKKPCKCLICRVLISFDTDFRSGNDQYLEHLSAFLEVLGAILENIEKNTVNQKSTKRL